MRAVGGGARRRGLPRRGVRGLGFSMLAMLEMVERNGLRGFCRAAEATIYNYLSWLWLYVRKNL